MRCTNECIRTFQKPRMIAFSIKEAKALQYKPDGGKTQKRQAGYEVVGKSDKGPK